MTLLNISARKRTNLRKMPNITTLASDDFEIEYVGCEEENGIVMRPVLTRVEGIFDKYQTKDDHGNEKERTGENPGGENPVGENPDGENPDGENPGGENPDGENPDGENPDGENPDGESPDKGKSSRDNTLSDVATRNKLSNGVLDGRNNEKVVIGANGYANGFETPYPSHMKGKLTSTSSMDEQLGIEDHWVSLQLSYGLPLFDSDLNKEICSKVGNSIQCNAIQ